MTSRTATDEPRPYALPTDSSLPYGRGELTAIMPPSLVRDSLVGWHPFPTADEPERWGELSEATRATLIAQAEAALERPWPRLRASVFADFQRNGDRARYEAPHFARRRIVRDLVLGAAVTGDDRFVDPIMDAVWSICEESFWGVPAHSFSRRYDRLPLPDSNEPVIDLFAAETGAQLAWTRYLLGNRLIDAGGDAFGDRLARELERRLLIPLAERDDWFWLGYNGGVQNNWNPWICSNLLVVTLLSDLDRVRRAELVSKIIAALDAYVDQLTPDGGCSEGQSYWAAGPAKLVDCLDALSGASDGALDGLRLPTVTALSRYPVAMHVAGIDLIQHADGPGQWLVEPSVLHHAGRLLGDPQARQLAIFLRDGERGESERSQTNLWRALSELFEPGYADAPATGAPLIGGRWFRDLQVMVAREQAGSTDGFLLCMKAGHNAEHHNHNDVGGISIAVDGHSLVIDPGVGTYTKQTFSPQRYQLREVNSDWHGLPVISSSVQSPGRQYAARDVVYTETDDRVVMSAELADAWPETAGIASYRRTATLDRVAGDVVIIDEWDGPTVSSLVLPLTLGYQPTIENVGRIDGQVRWRIGQRDIVLRVAGAAQITAESTDLDDPKLVGRWGGRIWRLLITPSDPPQHGRLELRLTRS